MLFVLTPFSDVLASRVIDSVVVEEQAVKVYERIKSLHL